MLALGKKAYNAPARSTILPIYRETSISFLMQRSEYLQFHWTPYPPAPTEGLYAGRILEIRRSKEFLHLVLDRNQQRIEFQIRDLSLAEVLVPGDLVVVDGEEKIHLMAPGEPQASPVSYGQLLSWQKYTSLIREFFFKGEFLEIQTPTFVDCPGTEPNLEAFKVGLHRGRTTKAQYLPTSPELHLKKALAMGFDKIFEIKTCFRNNEFSAHHQPEFLMLEWYRSYADLSVIEKDIRALLGFLMQQFPYEALHGPENFRVTTMAELFKQHADFTIFPWTTLEQYKEKAKDLGIIVQGAESIDDYFFAIFLERIEPHLPSNEMIFVKDYPPFQSALARLTPAGWADRMEIYFGGFELANAFHELNDPKIQRERFQEDLNKKKQSGREEVPIDEEFMKCLEKGMPPSAGIALGVERLFMALFKVKDIRSLKLFPY